MEQTVGAGRYVLGDLLGEGGMAAVHRAHDRRLDRDVAVKTMHAALGREDAFRERFQREAQAVARLNHHNVVAVHDSGEEPGPDGTPVAYIVMEYVDGHSLSDILRADIANSGSMDVDKALRITGDVLAALDASHEQGMVHRDIKPANVMISRRGETKVMDFGIARAQQSGAANLTRTGMMVGTPQYLSPEQAEGKEIDGRSDLYSVGVMLFQLLSGQVPFDGDSAFSIAYKHVTEVPPSLGTLGVHVPADVQELLNRALEKEPARRHPTAAAMRAEVERVRGGGANGGGPQGGYGTPPPPSSPPHAGYGTPPPATGWGHSRTDSGGGYPSAGPAPSPAYGTPYAMPGPATPAPAPSYPSYAAAPSYPQPGPQPGPPIGPQYGGGYVPQPRPQQAPDNTMAIIGVVLGGVSIPLMLILVGFLTAIPGVILGAVGKKKADDAGGAGAKIGLTAIILNCVAMALGVIWLAVILSTS